jgi:hypothetical protein
MIQDSITIESNVRKLRTKEDLNFDIYIAILICIIIGAASIQQGILSFLRTYIRLPLKLDVIAFYLIYGFVIFKAIKFMEVFFKKDVLSLLGLFYGSFLFTFFLPNSPVFLGEVMAQFTFAILCYAVARSAIDYEILYNALSKLALPISLSVILQLVFFQSDLYVEDFQLVDSYNQYQGYLALSAGIISLSNLMDRFNFLQLITFIISFSLIFIIGARGPVFCLILFYLIKLLLNNLVSFKGLFVIAISISFLSLVYLFYFKEIVEFASLWIQKFGLSSRLVEFINSDNFIEDENRNLITDLSINLIISNPLVGLGILRDRLVINSFLVGDINDAKGNYPHNIFLELYLHFGLIFGSIFILNIFRLLYLAIIHNTNIFSKKIVLIFLGIGLFPLFFSNSYLNAPLFFMLIGFCVSINAKKTYLKGEF